MNEFIKAIFTTSPYGRDFSGLTTIKNTPASTKKSTNFTKNLKHSSLPELFAVLDELINTLLFRQAIVSEQYYIAGFKTATHIATESNNLLDIFDP